jgi:hypothetical protein
VSSTFVAYVDESGDEGFVFGGGSSEWFVLSAVITRRASDLDAVRLVDDVRARLGRSPKKALHFRDLRHEHRLLYVDAIARANLRTASVLMHKPSLLEPEKFGDRYRLYFYAVRYLLERVSWYCRDHRTTTDAGDGSLELVFSNRSSMAYAELRDYLAHLKALTGPLDVRIEWGVVKETQVTSLSPGRLMGLQIVDAVAGSLFYALEPSQYGFTEDRYARMLKPVVYHHKGRYLGYGLKFWPRDAGQLLGEERYQWIRDHYK